MSIQSTIKNNVSEENGSFVEKEMSGNINNSTDYLAKYFELEELCRENMEYFKKDSAEKGQKLYAIFLGWLDHINKAKKYIKEIQEFVKEYDFDENTPGNGYRSFIRVTNCCINYGIQTCKRITLNRTKVFFRKGLYVKEIEACHNLLSSICTCLEYLLILRQWSSDGELFSNGIHTVEELFERGDAINQYCFYGRCLGFQYRQSIQGVLRFISICMAGFSESYYSDAGRIAKTTSSMWTSGKYFINPELRARRIVNISQNASIDFCKSFWFLAESELMHAIPSIVGSNVKVNTVIRIPPEPIKMLRNRNNDNDNNNDNNAFIDIPIPNCHIGPGPVSARLLCSQRRQNMLGSEGKLKNLQPSSKSLIFHCHGGGFVAQSSKSHELYLRDWAVALNTPILSIDYSLAPEAPFPRALEEVFYAYCWALNNSQLLGSTCEKVILAGDSAGANLCLGITLKCIDFDIRKPDGIFLAYCPTLVSFVPSPARMLCLMDPILPFGFMMRCLKAYACPSDKTIAENQEKLKALQEIQNASTNNITYSMLNDDINNCHLSNGNKSSTKSSSINGESKWEYVQAEDIQSTSPFSDCASDTFASASQTVENTDLITPEDLSSCLSFEDDSQPITHLPSPQQVIQENNENIQEQYKDNVINKTEKSSEEYVESFLKKYIENKSPSTTTNNGNNENSDELNLEKTTSKTSSEENIVTDTGKEIVSSQTIQSKLNNAVNSFQATMNKFISSSKIQPPHCTQDDLKKLNALIARSPSDEFVFQVPKDPFLSPYYAKNEDLQKFPRIKILTVDMDPCLDDCVMFAKKLKKLNVNVSLDILEGLPHGFLNFTMLSAEAMDGSKMCVSHISELLNNNESQTEKI